MKTIKKSKKNRIISLFLALMLALSLLSPLSAMAAGRGAKVVRVGWYDSAFNLMDDLGRRTGYAYEYQQKIALYTGWKYEYVEGSWPELMEMLKQGKIDLLSDVSYTEERSKDMIFSSLPMGSEEYYLFTTPDNSDITVADYSTFNGKKVGANKGSIQIDLFRKWASANNIDAEIIELTGSLSNNVARLIRGDFDLYLALDSDAYKDLTIPICKIGASDFYFAINKEKTDLAAELNSAMSHIHDDNRFFNQQLYNKYLKQTNFNSFLSIEEQKWLKKHKVIKFGYQDNYLAYCAKDPKTGELTGALSDYLKVASDCIENGKLEFEPVAFATSQEALEALKAGEIDCMFPINLTDYYGETKGFSISAPLMSTEMLAIVAVQNQDGFFKRERTTVAVNAGNPNYDMFLLDHFPEWRSIYFKDTPECLKAISQGKADCLLMSSFRYGDVSKLCEQYGLTQINAGVEMEYCLAVSRENATLYSILNKMISSVPETTMSTALSRYSTEEAKGTFMDYVKTRPALVVVSVAVTLLLIIASIIYNNKASKRAKQNRELISATETDSLTGLYTKSYFIEYANRIYSDSPKKPMDAIVVNIIRFHSVNAINGRVFGDSVLHALGEEIQFFVLENGGIAGRNESDHFAIYCPHLQEYYSLFERLQKRLDSLSTSANIMLRMGVMPWVENTEPQQMIEHALIACNLARGLYKERFVVFDEEMRQKELFEQQLINDLNQAIENRELTVYYQPKFDIQCDPPRLQSAEALVRWHHPKYGLITSSDFISLFERNGQISLIDNFVWKETARQAGEWKRKYNFELPISINLSRIDIFDSSLIKTLDSLVEENGLTQNAIELEVTESAYTENSEQLISIIEQLRARGYKLQMDDFGSGYSSLNMLSSMPIDALKMDKAFMNDIGLNTKRIQLVQLILDIAEDLRLPVIAEGVETEEQLRLLQDLGCAIAQGYYFSKPIPAQKFEAKYLEK